MRNWEVIVHSGNQGKEASIIKPERFFQIIRIENFWFEPNTNFNNSTVHRVRAILIVFDNYNHESICDIKKICGHYSSNAELVKICFSSAISSWFYTHNYNYILQLLKPKYEWSHNMILNSPLHATLTIRTGKHAVRLNHDVKDSLLEPQFYEVAPYNNCHRI